LLAAAVVVVAVLLLTGRDWKRRSLAQLACCNNESWLLQRTHRYTQIHMCNISNISSTGHTSHFHLKWLLRSI